MMAKKEQQKTKVPAKQEKYFEAVGRRKTAVARVRILGTVEKKNVSINGRPLESYFSIKKHQGVAMSPVHAVGLKNVYPVSVKVNGGGIAAQADAVRLGIARALILINPSWRAALKALGYLKRDPRRVERKKFGSRKARRPQQWRKR